VDVSDSSWKEQFIVTEKTLEEIGAGEVPRIFVFNKMDLLEGLPRLRLSEVKRFLTTQGLGKFPHLLISTKTLEGVAELRARVLEHFKAKPL
jgi:GTP-binding protein HflX